MESGLARISLVGPILNFKLVFIADFHNLIYFTYQDILTNVRVLSWKYMNVFAIDKQVDKVMILGHEPKNNNAIPPTTINP